MSEISIIVPIYHIDEMYLKQCLESLVQQTFSDIEIVLIDDGSPDHCGMLSDQYAKQDARVIVIHQKNAGVSVARNKGIERATGKYIMFVDPDDWLETDCCEQVLKTIQRNDYEAVFFQRVEEYGNVTKRFDSSRSFVLSREEIKDLQLGLLNGSSRKWDFDPLPVWGKIISKELIRTEKLKFIPGMEKAQDVLFNFELYEKLQKAYFLNYSGYHYRINDCSINHRYNNRMIQNMKDFSETAEMLIYKYGLNDERYLNALKVSYVNRLSTIEDLYFFHKDSRLTKDQVVMELKKWLKGSIIERADDKNCIKEFLTLKSKIRYFLIHYKMYNVYYYVMKLHYRVKVFVRANEKNTSN